MKKFLITKLPLLLAAVTLLIVTAFLRYNLYISTQQLAREFQTQNAKELYSIDTLKISTRLNSFSSAINWVCIEAESRNKTFFSMKNGKCATGLFQQQATISIPEADNIKVSFTLKWPSELQKLFILFLLLQIALIVSIIIATRKAEIERRRKESELFELSRKMFHDIRSPLASLNAVAEHFEESHSQELLLLRNSISRINDIANSLLEQTHKKTSLPKPSFTNVVHLVEQIIDEKKIEHKGKATLKVNAEPIENAFCIPNDFKRIVSNLLNNAIEASTDGVSIVKVEIKQTGTIVSITIRDNGKGIPDEILKKLGSEEITSKDQGNGIGFKHSLELLKEWQGDLRVLETGKNGTTLLIELQAEKKSLINEEPGVQTKPKQIVLIDDDELTRTTWAMKAKKSNISLRTYGDIASFKADMGSVSKDDVLYIDSELGEVKGEELAVELHELGFTDLSIASGHPPERFANYTFLRSVISKKAPF